MQLYSYFRSTAAYRVRIALRLKELEHEVITVDLLRGEQRTEAYLKENPQGLVPALKLSSGEVIGQSGAILEWLEECYPTPALYPNDPLQRATHRALCQHISCDIHPLNNLRVLQYLRDRLQQSDDAVDRWYSHWIQGGFVAIETALEQQSTDFSLGERPGMLELMLIPQVFNARRFHVDIEAFPRICALDQRCNTLPAFADSHPSLQADAPPAKPA